MRHVELDHVVEVAEKLSLRHLRQSLRRLPSPSPTHRRIGMVNWRRFQLTRDHQEARRPRANTALRTSLSTTWAYFSVCVTLACPRASRTWGRVAPERRR